MGRSVAVEWIIFKLGGGFENLMAATNLFVQKNAHTHRLVTNVSLGAS